ncbi:Uma2 family endonuclease [Actinoallomurus rhizosphaericola]|uniref:Uma2 family endonuclease n=1 Tax=Actinoallomurus rhizosphaericola TaxID=2952536 RepID=UPI00209145F0|nr:Uma2 family endonuclease [Actinoallomurus rhizosphaericola]MCO5993116.1 Uma2 family endonuclease [Actinoallomurus rhizosphaericola]
MSLSFTESHGHWTVDALRRLPEDELHRYEIDDGVLIVSPRPASPHQAALLHIAFLLNEPAEAVELKVLPEVEVVTHRRDDWLKVPDLVVVTLDAFESEPQEYEAADVVLAVEISGNRQSRNRDFGEKLEAYAEAGIPHYWIAELVPAPRLTVFELADGAYREVVASEEPVKLTRPFGVEVDPGRFRGTRRR